MFPAKYTEVLANIIDAGIDIFDFDYTSYLPKEELQNGFIDYYLYREIGFETIEMFKQRLKVRWQNIIERYNMIFEADAAVVPQDAFTDSTHSDSENITSKRTIGGMGQSVFNDAPLGQVPFDNTHASAITNSEQNSTDDYSEQKTREYSGLSKGKAQAMIEFEKNLRDHKKEFFDEFRDLFFGLL